jgi:hypothetical protein
MPERGQIALALTGSERFIEHPVIKTLEAIHPSEGR